MNSLKDFLPYYNNKDSFLTLETKQNKIAFYQDKNINIL